MRTFVTGFAIILLGLVFLQGLRSSNNSQGAECQYWTFDKRIAVLSSGKSDRFPLVYQRFPTVVRWYKAKISEIKIVANSPSIVVANDIVRGTVLVNGENEASERTFELRFDSSDLLRAKDTQVGDFWYIGVDDDWRLFDLYLPTDPPSDVPNAPPK